MKYKSLSEIANHLKHKVPTHRLLTYKLHLYNQTLRSPTDYLRRHWLMQEINRRLEKKEFIGL